MRFATCSTENGSQGARLDGQEYVLTESRDAAEAMVQFMAGPISGSERRIHQDDAVLLNPCLRPAKIICVGLNYRSHIEEMGRELPTHPTLFAKFARSLIGPVDDIQLPASSREMDWEAELGVVVGREVRNANLDEAQAAIGGYTIVNDVSARDWQWRTTQWLSGKTFEASTPVGPVIVTPDEVDGAKDLELVCEIDGEVMQRSRTSDLLFGPAALVSYISKILTLEPGDLIATGTPAGVGAGRSPKRFLSAGSVVRTAIEGIGELRNSCVTESEI